jgi:hypothetical protein
MQFFLCALFVSMFAAASATEPVPVPVQYCRCIPRPERNLRGEQAPERSLTSECDYKAVCVTSDKCVEGMYVIIPL